MMPAAPEPNPLLAGPGPRPIARLERRLFHLCAASCFPTLLLFYPRLPVFLAALGILAAHLALEGARLRIPAVNAWAVRTFAPLMKERERAEPFAATYLIIATCIAIAAFRADIAALALFFVAIGDPLAALVGQRWGTHRIGSRTVEGSLAFLGGALAIGVIVTATGSRAGYGLMALGACSAALAELTPLPLDDNLKVPLLSGVVMTLAASF